MKITRGKYGSIEVERDGSNLTGEYEMSPNGRYTIAWCDGHLTVDDSGQDMRQHIPGEFLLLDRDKQLVRGSRERPNNGHVADNGTFVLCDWTFKRNNGVFSATDRSGKLLLERQLGKMSSCGISPDGRYACCQTVRSDRDDANKLHFFDLSSGELLWAKEPETGTGARSYRFDTEKGVLYLVYSEWGPLAYSFAGEFLDARTWQQRQSDEAQKPDYFTAEDIASVDILAVEDIVTDEDIIAEDIRAIDEIIDTTARRSRGQEIFVRLQQAWKETDDPITQARICRVMGELFEVLDLPDKAIQCYERALGYDEMVGVRRRLALLKRKVSQPSVG